MANNLPQSKRTFWKGVDLIISIGLSIIGLAITAGLIGFFVAVGKKLYQFGNSLMP